jgi:hypothetical protein
LHPKIFQIGDPQELSNGLFMLFPYS